MINAIQFQGVIIGRPIYDETNNGHPRCVFKLAQSGTRTTVKLARVQSTIAIAVVAYQREADMPLVANQSVLVVGKLAFQEYPKGPVKQGELFVVAETVVHVFNAVKKEKVAS